jgi:hypothetical protein
MVLQHTVQIHLRTSVPVFYKNKATVTYSYLFQVFGIDGANCSSEDILGDVIIVALFSVNLLRRKKLLKFYANLFSFISHKLSHLRRSSTLPTRHLFYQTYGILKFSS